MKYRPSQTMSTFKRGQLLAFLFAASCFTGDDLVAQPCEIDEDCNPKVDPLGARLRCFDNVCRENPRTCGDGVIDEEAGEDCDDGNRTNGDFCSDDCRFEQCGDGLIQAPEVCDDGNKDSVDACVGCRAARCGDGYVRTDNDADREDCDDGNAIDDDSCSAQCRWGSCGDGKRQGQEECDDGNDDNTDDCVSCRFAACGDNEVQEGSEVCDDGNNDYTDDCVLCQRATCGDGVIQAGEEDCDDGNNDGDGCSADCKFERCGDGVRQDPEECDDGNDVNTDACVGCKLATCGDGATQTQGGAEQCDDGNQSNTDVCTAECTAAACGDGFLQPPNQETCDDGDLNADSNACTADCKLNVCGDGKQGPGEACDDGNQVNGDGCSDSCEGPPEAAVLKLDFSQVKQFDFSWAAAGGATFYRLLERPTPNAAYTQLGADIVGTATARTMPLHRRFGASYILSACNDAGCTDSAPVDVVDSMAAAVGYFKASNTGAADLFGRSIALSADGNTLAVGADFEDSAATGVDGDQADNSALDAGAVYVFVRTNNSWSQQAYVKASNTDVGDYFGGRIALSADGNTLAVGAYNEDSAATGIGGNQADNAAVNAGAVYAFVRTNNAWSQQAYVKASNTGAGDYFGASIALSADGNTLAVGAYLEDSAATGIGGNQADNAAQAGAVYVFVRTNNSWSQQAYVKASNTDAGDYFGVRIALSADGNTLAVDAINEDSAATGIGGDQADNPAQGAGAVYVFVRTNNAWSQQAYVKASNTGAGDGFGGSIALSADGNTLAVGAYNEDSAATGIGGNQADNATQAAGAVYVFVRMNNSWSQQAYVKASNTGAGDFFGGSIALAADGNTLAVGAYYEESAATGIGGDQADNAALDAGAVYVFVRTNNAWSQKAYVKASNTGAVDFFGFSIAFSADGNTLAIGADFEDGAAKGIGGDQADNAAKDAGAIYVY